MREKEPALASVGAHTGGKGDWLEGGRGRRRGRQDMGLERTGGKTRDREQRRMKRVRGKNLCSGPCKEAPAGVEMF